MNEIWKDIEGYEGLYQISNLGNIKSIKRQGTNGAVTKRISKIGYYTIDLYKKTKRQTKYLHRLIAETFIPNPNNLRCINHKNGIKTDNRIDNLEWCSYSENNKHAYCLGLKSNCKGIAQIDKKTKKVLNTFYSINEAARKTNICQSSISLCCNKERKEAGGYLWKFLDK